MTDDKRFTTVELPKPNKWGIWYDGAYLSTYQVCILLNEYVDVKKENEQLKQREQTLLNEIKDFQDLLASKEEIYLKPVIQTIEEAYENERTALGKSILKQLLNKME